MEELTKLPGIGRKSANIILQECFNKVEGIAVVQDDHNVIFVQYLIYAKKMIKLYTKRGANYAPLLNYF